MTDSERPTVTEAELYNNFQATMTSLERELATGKIPEYILLPPDIKARIPTQPDYPYQKVANRGLVEIANAIGTLPISDIPHLRILANLSLQVLDTSYYGSCQNYPEAIVFTTALEQKPGFLNTILGEKERVLKQNSVQRKITTPGITKKYDKYGYEDISVSTNPETFTREWLSHLGRNNGAIATPRTVAMAVDKYRQLKENGELPIDN